MYLQVFDIPKGSVCFSEDEEENTLPAEVGKYMTEVAEQPKICLFWKYCALKGRIAING
jgi:hypothetical protein